MHLNLDDKFQKFLSVLFNSASSLNLRLFIVGGAVRDYFLNIPVKDFDLILEGNAIEFAASLPDFVKIKSVHNDFGTVKLLFEDMEFDLASTRCEKYPYSGCLPVVDKIGVPIELDVLRRDFTINSMYFEILNGNHFKLIDLVGGCNDIASKTLKVLHDKSYTDDPTRIFRGLAFKYRFGFDFSYFDKELIENYLKNSIDYSNMSMGRLINVFKKSLNYSFCFDIFEEIIEKKYYKALTSADLDINFEFLKSVISDFKLTSEEFCDFCGYIIESEPVQAISSDKLSDIYKTFSKLNNAQIAYYYFKTRDIIVFKYLKIKNIKLNIKGSDILNLGYTEGRIIGEILDSLFNYKLNNPDIILNFNDELDWVKTNFPLK